MVREGEERRGDDRNDSERERERGEREGNCGWKNAEIRRWVMADPRCCAGMSRLGR